MLALQASERRTHLQDALVSYGAFQLPSLQGHSLLLTFPFLHRPTLNQLHAGEDPGWSKYPGTFLFSNLFPSRANLKSFLESDSIFPVVFSTSFLRFF